VAAARVGTRCPVIGANGGADGFRRIARRTGITAIRLPIGAGEVLTTEAGVPPEVGTARMGAEATMAVDGAIPSAAPRAIAATVLDERQVRGALLGAVADQNVFGTHRENVCERLARIGPVPHQRPRPARLALRSIIVKEPPKP